MSNKVRSVFLLVFPLLLLFPVLAAYGTITPVCGDGSRQGTEACDDGNLSNGDGCSSTCTVESGWICTGSPSVCTNCGNGSVEGTEACDDGNLSNGDGCSSTCIVESGWICTGSPSVCNTDSDGDGVADAIENAAPNNGDGNNDGIQDSLQDNVASLPTATGQGYMTLVVSGGCGQINNVHAFTQAQMAEPDSQHNYIYGLVSFELPCENGTVAITYHNAVDLTGEIYRKYGPTTPGNPATIQWYNFPNAVMAGNVMTLTLADNALGDDTGDDGIIYDQGGPTDPEPIPTMNEWGMMIFVVLAGVGGMYYLRKQKTAKS